MINCWPGQDKPITRTCHTGMVLFFFLVFTQTSAISFSYFNNSNDKKHVKPSTMASKASLLRLVRLPKMYIQQNKLLYYLLSVVYDSEYL